MWPLIRHRLPLRRYSVAAGFHVDVRAAVGSALRADMPAPPPVCITIGRWSGTFFGLF